MEYELLRCGRYAKCAFIFEKEDKATREMVGAINAHQAERHVVQDAAFRSVIDMLPEQGKRLTTTWLCKAVKRKNV